jgi:benzoyl-CoA reductase/2-hydroxyglutaryl-CoA dehydratase subunit BcrC/BadD/HgdB
LHLGSYFSSQMNRILYTSPYVPAEWIEAHGLDPCRVIPSAGGCAQTLLNRQGVCPFVRSFCSHVISSQESCGIVMATTCDQMRRAFEVVVQAAKAPAIMMNVPRTWQTVAARRLYVAELGRVSDFLVEVGGSLPSNDRLIQVMRGDRWAKAHPTAHSTAGPAIRLALVGGPMRKEDQFLFDFIEQCGGVVALDATEGGEAGSRRPFEQRSMVDDPLLELADAYFDGIADIARRPNDGYYQWLIRRTADLCIQGIIVLRYVGCDLWHAEVESLRQKVGLPLLDLDADGQADRTDERSHTRVSAFMEALA